MHLLPALAAALLLAARPAAANGGGGGGAGLGTLLAVLATVAAVLVGVVWFPLKRLIETIRVDEIEGEDPGAG